MGHLNTGVGSDDKFESFGETGCWGDAMGASGADRPQGYAFLEPTVLTFFARKTHFRCECKE